MILLYIIILCNFAIGPINVADIGVILLLGLALLSNKTIYISKNKFILLFLPVVAIIPLLINVNKDYFVLSDFILSFLKFVFYLLALLIIPYYLSKNDKKLDKTIYNIVKIIFIYAIFQIVIYYIAPNFIVNLFIKSTSTTYGIFRVTSVFKEPAHIFYAVILYFLLIYRGFKVHILIHLIVIIVSILSFSLVVYGIYLGALFILYYRGSLLKKSLTILTVISLFVLSYLTVSLVQTHIRNLLSMKPSSASSRIFGGFEYVFKVNPMGIGMGQITNYYEYYKDTLNFKLVTNNGTVHNVIPAFILYFGVLGFLLFFIYIFKEYKYSKRNLCILIISFFAWGAFNGALFFTLLIIIDAYNVVNKRKSIELSKENDNVLRLN